jgi:hypothetical protein
VSQQLDLFADQATEVYSVHCFFNCPHIVRKSDPYTASAAMERHYGEQHRADINRAIGFLR